MSDVSSLSDFLDPVDRVRLSHDEGYSDGLIGRTILANEDEIPDLDNADIVLVGCGSKEAMPIVPIHSLPMLFAVNFTIYITGTKTWDCRYW